MIQIVKQGLCYGIACTDVNPNDEDSFERVDKELKQIPSGTENGWVTVKKDEDGFREPAPCEKEEGLFHYLIVT